MGLTRYGQVRRMVAGPHPRAAQGHRRGAPREAQGTGGQVVSQCEALLAHLQTGASITPLEALRLCGTLRLSERIRELEAQGVTIAHNWQGVGRKRVMSYRLAIP